MLFSKDFFKGKRILVTGDTGFKGSWLSYWLWLLGAEVYGYALPPERGNDHFHLLGLTGKIRHCDGDIRDAVSFTEWMEKAEPEIVFHLAAQALVRKSYVDVKETFDTNIGGSVNLLEYVRQHDNVRSVVFVTSDKSYKNKEWIWGYRETDELGGRDPYSASKSAAELVFQSYLLSFFNERDTLGAASVRAGNVIGGGDWSADRIVPDSVKALAEGETIVLRNPGATRPWQHVLEPLGGYMLLAERLYGGLPYNGAWNFGPDDASMRTVGDLAEKIVECWGSGGVRQEIDGNAPHEAGLLHLNCDKARFELGWQAKWDFEMAVQMTIDWYKGYFGKQDVEQVTRRQIEEYMR
jgi:CDP-glucose 4,6-dehydratase